MVVLQVSNADKFVAERLSCVLRLPNRKVPVSWNIADRPAENSEVRIIPGNAWSGTICARDLTPLGVAQFTFDPHGAALNGSVTADGEVRHTLSTAE